MSKKDRESNRAARAAAIRKRQQSVERRRRVLVTLAVVVVLGVVVGGGALLAGGSGSSGGDQVKVDARADGQALVVGNDPDAPKKVVIYEDFLCPYCRQFESATRDFLRKDAAAGKVLVEYRPFHLLQDDYSSRALSTWAAVLQNGTPEQALRYHDALYENQPYESASDKPDVDKLTDLAKDEAGIENGSVLDAMKQPDQAFVDAADKAASDAGVSSTPSVFVDGKELKGSSIDDMASSLEDMLGS